MLPLQSFERTFLNWLIEHREDEIVEVLDIVESLGCSVEDLLHTLRSLKRRGILTTDGDLDLQVLRRYAPDLYAAFPADVESIQQGFHYWN